MALAQGSSFAAVVGLLVAGVASAAIVSYISNATTATVAVASPVEMRMNPGQNGTWSTAKYSLTLAPSFGGSSIPFTTIARNSANNRIGGYYVMVMEATASGDHMTGEEFTSIDYTINESGYTGEDGDLIALGKLCVVRGDGSLTKLAEIPTWTNEKMILFYDYDSIDSAPDGNVAACSELTPILAGETRSFTHIGAGADRVRTFTPTWATSALGTFTISSQYVNDFAKFAAETYE